MHPALPYDISPITPSNFDTDFFFPKHIHQYCFLPGWWLSPSNQLAFILGYTGMQTAFSSHTKLFPFHCHHQSLQQIVNLWCMEFIPSKTEGSLRHWKALHGSQALVCRQQKGAGRCPSYLIAVSLFTSDYFIRFPLSASTPKLIYRELQSLFPRLLSASLFWLPSLFLFPTERDSLLDV